MCHKYFFMYLCRFYVCVVYVCVCEREHFDNVFEGFNVNCVF